MQASSSPIESRSSDFAELLTLAESLREKVDRLVIQRRMLLMYAVLGAFVALGCLVLGILSLLGRWLYGSAFGWFVTIPVGFAGASFALVSELNRRERGRSLQSEVRALNEVIVLISETQGALAEAHNWTPLQRAQYTIRMSRLRFAAEMWQWMDHGNRPRTDSISMLRPRE